VRDEPPPTDNIALANFRQLADAVRMIREAIETSMGGAAKLQASEQFGTAYEECEAMAHAIARFAGLEQAADARMVARDQHRPHCRLSLAPRLLRGLRSDHAR
jgi:hypothetical protein